MHQSVCSQTFESMNPSCKIQIDDKGHKNQHLMKKVLQLLKEGDDIATVRHILENNKILLSLKHNDRKSILPTLKYDLKSSYTIISLIIDVGYNLYNFSQDSSAEDKFQALFFAAAKGDLERLSKIVEYFTHFNVTKLHDTREGDSVLSFMIKFGDYSQERFVDCFQLLVEQGIDVTRIDYFKKNVRESISLERKNARSGSIPVLNKMQEYLNNCVQVVNPNINHKYKLFEAIIKYNKIKDFNKELLDSDDGENTLLQLAIIKDHFEATRVLLQEGANPNEVVKGGNKVTPLVLAAKLARDKIFKEILKAEEKQKLKISDEVFAMFVKEVKPKYFNFLLESHVVDVDIEYKGKIPLFYAITRKNRAAVQLLIQRGSRIDKNCLQCINPKDLEDYLNSCIKADTFSCDTDERNYKFLLIFDFFINSCRKIQVKQKEKTNYELSVNESQRLYDDRSNSVNTFDTEIKIIRYIGNNKRLKHLLEHPLIYIYIILKWQCVKYYYIFFVVLSFTFYLTMDILLYKGNVHVYLIILMSLLQSIVVIYNFSLYKYENKQHILQCLLETSLLSLLIVNVFIQMIMIDENKINLLNQISAFIFIITSINILLTIGYNIIFSKWMAMVKRIFSNFFKLLLFFMPPILAFAASFTLLLPDALDDNDAKNDTKNATKMEDTSDNADFGSFYRSMIRIFIMMGGDIGEKKFSSPGAYLIFLLFAIGMVIILLNFWTGIAVSDINKIEQQSTIMAFKYVIVFIENTERMYELIFEKLLASQKNNILIRWIRPPLLKSRMYMEKPKSEKKYKKNTFQYGIELYVNCKKQFKRKHFENCKIDGDVISKIKTLSERNDENLGKTVKELLEKLNKIEQLLQKQNRTYRT